MERDVSFSELLGKTLSEVSGMEKGSDNIVFVTTAGERFRMFHSQDCCESVSVEDIVGDPADLIGSPLTLAEEASNDKMPPGYVHAYQPESCTWTFYRIATARGHVDLRWLGESNGYYGEGVDFVRDQP